MLAIPHSIEDHVCKALDGDEDSIQDLTHYTKLSLVDKNSVKSGIMLKSESATEDENSDGSTTASVELANIAFACIISGLQSALGE